MRLILALILLVLATPALAQSPEMRPYCPPGGPMGYAPVDHPSVAQWPCSPYDPAFRPPLEVQPPVVPDPAAHWTLRPDDPLEIGHAYVDPYGMVWLVIGVQGLTTPGGASFSVPLGWLIVLHYQSGSAYRAGELAGVSGYPATQGRGMRWEIER